MVMFGQKSVRVTLANAFLNDHYTCADHTGPGVGVCLCVRSFAVFHVVQEIFGCIIFLF